MFFMISQKQAVYASFTKKVGTCLIP